MVHSPSELKNVWLGDGRWRNEQANLYASVEFTADDEQAVIKTCLLCGDREIVRVLSQTAWTIEKPTVPGWYW
jgi:hypothetical protein